MHSVLNKYDNDLPTEPFDGSWQWWDVAAVAYDAANGTTIAQLN